MGVLTQAFVADPDEIALFEGGPESPDGLLKGLDDIKLSALGQLLLEGELDLSDEASYGTTYDELVKEFDESMHSYSSGEEWAFLVPARLTGALAYLAEDRLPGLAETWSRTEEFELDQMDAEDGLDYLRELRAQATAAQNADKQLYLWMSL